MGAFSEIVTLRRLNLPELDIDFSPDAKQGSGVTMGFASQSGPPKKRPHMAIVPHFCNHVMIK